MEIKKCKNKECQKIMPEGCKYKYCEACRSKRAENTKKGLEIAGGAILTALTIVLTKGHSGKKG